MMGIKPRDPAVEAAIKQFEVAAINFAYQGINISSVRSEYLRRAQEASSSIRLAYRNGEMSAKAAAEAAHGLRNMLLDQQRARSAAIGRAYAIQQKKTGRPFEQLVSRYSKDLHGKVFSELDNVEQTRVFLEIVDSAGRPKRIETKYAARAGAAGRALFILGLGIAVYNIANAEDKVWQTGREASGIGGGLGGSIAAGALAGIWFGPIGAAIGALVGGVAGALMADQAYVATVGASDRAAGAFLKRFTNFYSTDEQGIANALYAEAGINMDRVNAVFLAMDESYTTDADDVAVIYLHKVFAGQGTILESMRLNRDCKATLIRVLDEGWTTDEEQLLIGQLRGLH